MNDQMNAPMSSMPSGSGPVPFYQVWINALTKPNEQTYADIANSPNAKASTAYMWVFGGSLISAFLSLLVQGALLRSQLSGVGGGKLSSGFLGIAITLICGTPIVAIIGTLFFAIFTALIQWIAKLFGGKGTNDQLAYVFAAITVPYSILSGIFILLSAIPFVGICFRLILGLAGLYILVLEIMAVKATNQLDWGRAAGSVLIPGASLFLICCCAVFGISMVAGASATRLFQQFKP